MGGMYHPRMGGHVAPLPSRPFHSIEPGVPLLQNNCKTILSYLDEETNE